MATIIDSNIEPVIRGWLESGRGVTVWQNLEIASGRPLEVFTPSDAPKPDWRYGSPASLSPIDIQVRHAEAVESFRGRFKAMYWGPWVNKGTEAKAERICAKHGLAKGSWSWKYEGDGLVIVTIERSIVKPFQTSEVSE